MGHDEFQRKLAAAERTGTRDRYVDLMQYARKENIRAPRAILRVGNVLVTKHRRGLGDELWNIYEQTFLAALDGQDETVAEMCLHELTRKFPRSARVARLRGMHLEHQGEWDEALTLYNELLEANGANTAVLKRKIAVLKAQGKTRDVVHALNDYLRLFGTDPAAWTELGETYLAMGTYRYAAFCYEELVLLNPMDAIAHTRVADIYATIGGLENLLKARKHYAHALELHNTTQHPNLRACFGLVTCTIAVARQRTYRADQDEHGLNDRLRTFALAAIQATYAEHAGPDVVEIAQKAMQGL